MRSGMIAILVSLCVGWAVAQDAVNPPPRPLYKVGDHWTPYQPPTELPADAQVYIIQPGDTLWALAKRFLGDPYLWPQLWEKNTYIRDAHWIYPGDPLIVGVKTEVVPVPDDSSATGAQVEGEPAQPSEPETPWYEQEGELPADATGAPTGKLVAVGTEADVYCFAYLADKNAKPTLTIHSAEQIEYQENFSTGDIVYLSGGEAEGVKAGQEFFIDLPVRRLLHPRTRAVLGLVVRQLGRVKVLCVQEHSSTAEVMDSCDTIPLGAWVTPFEPYPVPMALLTEPIQRCDPPSDQVKGTIIYSRDDIEAFGADHTVLIDLGDADEIDPGTVLTIFRENRVEGAPRLVLGELAVLIAGDHWATAKVLSSNGPMRVGDRVELK